jgi:GNAT superfamily N-acetyltransferase
MDATGQQLEIRQISTAETLPLRREILRRGRPPETARFPGDDDPATRHFGVFRGHELAAIASLFAVEFHDTPRLTPAYQLRGMAVSRALQKSGLGFRLLSACIDYARSAGAKLLWCNARAAAAGFYRKYGFQTFGAEFDIPDVGPHFRMLLEL